jgi:hypothetical protein
MRAIAIFCLAALVACADSSSDADGGSAAAAGAGSGEWRTLFDGTDLANFRQTGDADWELSDRVVGARAGSGMLVTNERFSNFELEVEFWVDEPANSGVFIRCPNPDAIADTTCYEVNIYDTRPDQTYRTGGIVNFAAPTAVMNAAGRWNRYRIVADGPHLQVEFNGVAVVDTTDEKYSEGHIGLQHGAGVVLFRAVKIREL